jgi:N-acylneuraminate cytidylyltransferase/CMP-N,N'-diacetyllegionaminic acid synthase
MEKTPRVLAYIPARSGSKRIPGKNIKDFLGKPLIAYTIEQAKSVSFFDKVIVDTDSSEIADIAKQYGAEVPFLRPPELAQDGSKIMDSIFYALDKLAEIDGYVPTHLVILQTTSPLREKEDIINCWNLLRETGATTVVTICSIHPKFYHLNSAQDLILVNNSENLSTNAQDWETGYMLNGAVFIEDVEAIRKEKKVITDKTKAIVCPKWRSVDIDVPEEWAMAELLYKNKKGIYARISELG